MLIFSDSRQDAAYMAGTIKDEHLKHMLRQLITQVVWKQKGLTYNKLEEIIVSELQRMDPELREDEIKQYLIEEISSVTARQRSPENLGLISIEYSGLMSLDVKGISEKLSISSDIFKKYLV